MKSLGAEVGGEPKSTQPLSEMAYHALTGMLLSGELQPNELVTERQIATRLGISRTPLREAVRRLEGERFFERQRSGALVVRPLPIEEFMHILAVRSLLEGEAARLAAGHVPKDELQRLRNLIDKFRKLPPDAKIPEFSERDRDLHLLIASACGNPVLERMLDDLRTRLSMFRFGRAPSRRAAVCDEHLAIIDALLAGNGDAARSAMQHHIGQVRAVILERLAPR